MAPRHFLYTLHLAAAAAAHRYVILRHGETNHNAAGIIQGSSDFSRLTASGVQQARTAGEQLEALDVRFQRVYASPLTRAQQTYQEVGQAYGGSLPDAVSLRELREVDLGPWEGRPKTELKAEMPEEYHAWSALPLEFALDGERPIVNLWERARVAWELMRHDEGSDDGVTLVVAHNVCFLAPTSQSQKRPSMPAIGSTTTRSTALHDSAPQARPQTQAIGQALVFSAFGLGPENFRRLPFPNCGAIECEWPHGAPVATRWRWRLPAPETAEWSAAF